MSNLSDIGFPVRGDEEIYNMIQSLLPHVKIIPCPQGIYYRFTDESGAEMYLQANHSQELIGFNPHFDGKSRRFVGLTKTVERDSSELDGGYHAWANPVETDDDESSGDYPFIFDSPDFRTAEQIAFPANSEIQLTAFASNEFQIFSSEKDYYDSQDDEIKMASKSFIPSGMFLPDEQATPIEPPRPIAMFAGEIKEFELRTNQLTNQKFYWFLVDTLGGEVDVVADPKLIVTEPEVGNLLSGQFWLSGRLVNAPESPE